MKRLVCMVLAVLMLSSCLCSCDTNLTEQSNATTQTTTYQNFKANKSNNTTVYTDADIFAADAILGKAKDKNGDTIGVSNYAFMSKITDWKYKEVAEGLIEKSYRIGSAEFWQDTSKILNGKFGELFSWKKDMYKSLLMDYLTYYGQSEELKSNFEEQTTKFSYDIYKKFLNGANDIYQKEFDDYLESYQLKEAIEYSNKYGWISTLKDFTTIVDDITSVSKTSLEYYQNLSKALALKEVNESRINFLKKVKEVSNDEDLKKAVDEIVETVEGSYASIHFNEYGTAMFNSLIEFAWNGILAECGVAVNAGTASAATVNFYQSLMSIKLGKEGLNWLFNSDDYSQCIMELTIIYIISVDIGEAYSQLMYEYQNNPSHQSASNFVNGYLCCLNYQSYASTIADKYLMKTFFDGALNKLKNMFSNENSVSYKWMKTNIDNNKKMCVSCNKLVGTYYSAFYALYGYDDSWLYKNTSSYTWLVEPTIEADDIIVFDESKIPDTKTNARGEKIAQRKDYAIIQKDNKYGFISYSGENISKINYQHIYTCSHGCGAIDLYNGEFSNFFYVNNKLKLKSNKYGCQHGRGGVPSAASYDSSSSKAAIVNLSTYQTVTDYIFDKICANYYGDSEIVACKKDGKWGYYSYYDGREIIPCQFDDVKTRISDDVGYNAYIPTCGYIAVKKDGGYGYYNTDGKEVIPCGEFEQARPVYDGKAWVKKNGKWGVISIDGTDIDINETEKSTNTIEINDSQADFNIPTDAKTYNGHSYYVYSDVCDTWEEAKEYCEALGGYLAVLNDEAENKAVFDIMKELGYDNAYFGYTDSENEGNWKWVNNADSNYENWSDGEPNNEGEDENYAMFYYKSPEYQWNDGDFSGNTVNGEKQFICEWDAG